MLRIREASGAETHWWLGSGFPSIVGPRVTIDADGDELMMIQAAMREHAVRPPPTAAPLPPLSEPMSEAAFVPAPARLTGIALQACDAASAAQVMWATDSEGGLWSRSQSPVGWTPWVAEPVPGGAR
jgi:hypothetical protein